MEWVKGERHDRNQQDSKMDDWDDIF